jgi:hypothetical protein
MVFALIFGIGYLLWKVLGGYRWRADGEQKSNDQRWKARRVTVRAGVENPSPSRARFTVDWSSRVGSLRG